MNLTHKYIAPGNKMWIAAGYDGNPHKGHRCQVLIYARGKGPRNILIQFEDGHRVITINPRRSVRRIKDDRQMEMF